jgi:hypothetical protein
MAELELEGFAELKEVLREVRCRLSRLYGEELCTFEHGAACPSNRAGACIDHAHVHVLPTNCDVSEHLAAFQYRRLSALHDLRVFDEGPQSYIYYEPEPGQMMAYTCDERVPSQFMRRLICEQLGNKMAWDWRVAPYSNKIDDFLAKWTALFPTQRSEIPEYVPS